MSSGSLSPCAGATSSGATIPPDASRHLTGTPAHDLKGRNALVTGAGGGIGAGIARALAAAGAHVTVNDIDGERAGAVAAEIVSTGGAADAVTADVSQPDAVAGLVATAGPVDVLVNNVGVSHDSSPMEQIPLAELDRMVAVNLRSGVLCCRAVLPSMTGRGWGRIVNVASRTWLGASGLTFYSGTKGGVISFSRSLALELGRSGVTVNVVAPGTIRSPAFDRMPPAQIEALMDRNPARRFGQPDDVGRAVRFLASPKSAALTGVVLHVCGGRSLYGGPSSGLTQTPG